MLNQGKSCVAFTLARAIVCLGLLSAFVFLLPCEGRAQGNIYPLTTAGPIPANAVAAAVADVNGDNKPDLVIVTSHGGSLAVSSVLDFAENSTPSAATSLAALCTPTGSPIVADVNKDGKPDVVLNCGQYVAVLLGNGDGTFQTAQYYAVNPNSILLVDLKGNGYPAIVTSNCATNPQFAVLMNNGTVAAGANQFTVVSNPACSGSGPGGNWVEAAGDFNGDGKQDVVMYSFTPPLGNSLVLFPGNGDGTFGAPLATSLQSSAAAFTAGDFNGDGKTDIAYSSADGIQILFGSSSGTFTAGPLLSGSGTSLLAAPLTSSGAIDIIAAGQNTVVFHGDGKGNFAQAGSYAPFGIPYLMKPLGATNQDLYLVNLTADDAVYILTGNGDATFQAIPSTIFNTDGTSPVLFADFNGDGLGDFATVMVQGAESVVSTALARGDGTFGRVDQTLPTATRSVMAGDFNGDGKVDLIAIDPGAGIGHGNTTLQYSQVTFFAGNGNATFQNGVSTSIPILGASSGVADDFNGDGKLDLVLPYDNIFGQQGDAPAGDGLVFLPGKGDGTFGVPVPFDQNPNPIGQFNGSLLVADLRNNGKLDVIELGQNEVFLGNGNGTFQQIPLTPANSGSVLAIADLNGDGIPDLVTGGVLSTTTINPEVYLVNPGVYLGNGDGTFQATPVYSPALPANSTLIAAAVADVNGDGHPDLVLTYSFGSVFIQTDNGAGYGDAAYVAVFYGDGAGNFAPDPNKYFAGLAGLVPGESASPRLFLGRFNNSAPKTPDRTLDVLWVDGTTATVLLNQKNAAPGPPSPYTTMVSLGTSATSLSVNSSVTLTALVTGLAPSGTVTFTTANTTLGTATLANGVASLTTSFTATGGYTVTASYGGDTANTSAVSNAVNISVMPPPSFSISANPPSTTLKAGQSATITITATPAGGYTGTLSFSCGALPTGVTCNFNPSSLNVAGSPTSTTLTISTTAATAANGSGPLPQHRNPWAPAGTLALAGMLGLALRGRTRKMARTLRGMCWFLLLAAAVAGAAGCGSGGSYSKSSNPGTPSGSYMVSVVVSANLGSSPALTLPLTVQ